MHQSPPLPSSARVRRLSGILPPGVTKQLGARAGVTRWFGVRMGGFAVREAAPGRLELDYRAWPVLDRLEWTGERWEGEGTILGRVRFCRFWLEPVDQS